jgi:hypothetical protein
MTTHERIQEVHELSKSLTREIAESNSEEEKRELLAKFLILNRQFCELMAISSDEQLKELEIG